MPAVKSPFADGGPVVIQNYTTTATPAIVQIYPPPTYTNPGGRAVIFSTNAHIDIPTITTRVTPYFVAGGGIASVRRTAEYIFPVPLATGAPQGSLIPVPIPRPAPISSSVTDLALTLGGGLDVGVISRLSIEVDLRYFRLLGERDQNVGRFGAGARYRF